MRKLSVPILAITAAVCILILSTDSIAHAAPFYQTTGPSRIIEFELDDTVYTALDVVVIEMEFANLSEGTLDYWPTVAIEDHLGRFVYESEDDDHQRRFRLPPNQSTKAIFEWTVPASLSEGVYTLTATLRNWDDNGIIYDLIEDDDGYDFEVRSGPALRVSRFSHDFGTVRYGQSPTTSFRVENAGIGEFEWLVAEWPNWIELLSSVSNTASGNLRIRMSNNVPLGVYEGSIVVESDAGRRRIVLSAEVVGELDGRIVALSTEQDSVMQGSSVSLIMRIENNGEVPLDYEAVFTIEDSDGSDIYDSSIDGERVRLFLEPFAPQDAVLNWTVPFSAFTGTYSVTAELRDWNDRSKVFDRIPDDESVNFRVREGPAIAVLPESWDFVAIQGESAEATFVLDGSRIGRLTWRVASWPDWLELVSPFTAVTGAGTFTIRSKDSVNPGIYSGNIVVSSNEGSDTASVVLIVQTAPTRTPTITLTPTIASTPATPTVTSSPTITNTPVPTLTPTRVPSTATPTPTRTLTPRPTHTRLPVSPTSTPTPTFEPTPTFTPTPSRAQAVGSTEATPTLDVPTNTPTPDILTRPPSASGGSCTGAFGGVSIASGVVNLMFLLSPVAMLAASRRVRRRKKERC